MKTTTEITNYPFACPVCGGNGLVPNGFYSQTSGQWATTSTTPEKCRSCNGTGIVWKPDNIITITTDDSGEEVIQHRKTEIRDK